MNMTNKKNIIGKTFIAFSIFILMFLIYATNMSNSNLIFTHIDEYFTLSFIKFPINELITITANDVHPPLYYLILKVVTKLSYIANLSKYNIIFLRLVSIIPYLLIMIISTTKIKDKYGWSTAGILSFSLLAMSEFSQFYFFIRMYSWTILFVVVAFLSVKEILENNKKYWAILTIFTILSAYTHYFAAITLIALYISLFTYFIYTKNMKNLKLELVSSIIAVISYIPWSLVLINQLNRVHDAFWIEPLDFNDMINFLSFYAVKLDASFYVKVIFILILISFIAAIIKKYVKTPSDDNIYLVLGVLTFLGTLLNGILVSFLFKPILIARYLIIPISIMWVSFSLYIGQIENEKILAILIACIFIFGLINVTNLDSYHSQYNKGVEMNAILENMNNEGNVTVICIDKQPLMVFGTYLNNCDVFSTVTEAYGLNMEKVNKTAKVNYIPKDKVSNLINKTNNTVYIIKLQSSDFDLKEHEMEEINFISVYHFYKITS